MKSSILVSMTMWLLSGCCTTPKPPDNPSQSTGTTNLTNSVPSTNSPALPQAVDEFDGTKNYTSQATEFANIWVISLPDTTQAGNVGTITVWVNTTRVEGHRVGTNVYCDQIQLVNDDPAHTVIASQDVFRSDMENANKDTDEITTGYALGKGDVFTLHDDGSDQFQKLRASLSKARIFVRLIDKQPSPHSFHVDSAKVQATLR